MAVLRKHAVSIEESRHICEAICTGSDCLWCLLLCSSVDVDGKPGCCVTAVVGEMLPETFLTG